jgi:hypothetical protein
MRFLNSDKYISKGRPPFSRTLGGDIKIRSELGNGATFRLNLPLNLAAD